MYMVVAVVVVAVVVVVDIYRVTLTVCNEANGPENRVMIIIQANPGRTKLKGPDFYFEVSESSSWAEL